MNEWSGILPVPGYMPCSEGPDDKLKEKFPFQLISFHTKRRTHSIQDVTDALEKIDPQRLWINTEDALGKGINDGDTVLVFNDRGKVKIRAKVTDIIMRGVIAMQQCAWYTPDENGIDERGSMNVLTSTKHSPMSKGNPQQTNLVDIRKCEE